MKRIGLYINPSKSHSFENARIAIKMLKDAGKFVYVSENAKREIQDQEIDNDDVEMFDKSDAIIVFGGDGTILEAVRKMGERKIPLFGVNYGNLGFMAEVEEKSMVDSIQRLLEKDYFVEERMMIDLEIDGFDAKEHGFTALNDVVISRGANTRLIDIRVYGNDTLIEEYRADGLIVATPTGSTAYSLSAGGPIIEPTNDSVYVITPICPHSLHNRSIVLDAANTIRVEADSKDNNMIVAVDGQKFLEINHKPILIKKSLTNVKLIKFKEYNFFNILRKKLSERI
ncbi:NAD(+)/NADH kinase [Alkalibacter rhizosphaerae]|uniref:NAD kinase n=1 Tax=Alkalibacter rhizosphaerae TaxID=2815577 RepID=A0A975AIC5_9FIRM|nr:NAD(+)/NADH kinase [Alkalibacter rhizosphaerae]QSX08933.1 NAD(+)/NADH kinase [Alkalibacter rhizosphaerae]